MKPVDFVLHIIPDSAVGGFAAGDILQVLLFSVLFGFALMALGERGQKLREIIDEAAHTMFGIIAIVVKAAPIGAFGAMAYTIGRYRPANTWQSRGPGWDLLFNLRPVRVRGARRNRLDGRLLDLQIHRPTSRTSF